MATTKKTTGILGRVKAAVSGMFSSEPARKSPKHVAAGKKAATTANVTRAVKATEKVIAKAKTIAGAVLDVFRQEPLPASDPFWGTENIIVLPHIGGPHPQRDRFVARLFVENLTRFLDGQPLKEVVDRAAGY